MVRVFRSLDEARALAQPSVTTIGNFDGVHLGHQAVLREVARQAAAHRASATVLTFDPHPLRVVAPERAPALLTTIDQRIPLFGECGIEQVLVLPFTKSVSELSPEEFVRRVLVEALRARVVVVGENFRFGHRHAGDVAQLRRLGAELDFLTETQPLAAGASSSRVREALGAGDVAAARRLLGRPYVLAGAVVAGAGIGSKKTVPTLNVEPGEQLLPAYGVYVSCATDAESGRSWAAVSNVGVRPTFAGRSPVVESHLLDAYDGRAPRRLRVALLSRIRPERAFPSAEELKAQILRDAGRAKRYHRLLKACTRRNG